MRTTIARLLASPPPPWYKLGSEVRVGLPVADEADLCEEGDQRHGRAVRALRRVDHALDLGAERVTPA